MSTIELSSGCQLWTLGSVTKHPPQDVSFLEEVVRSGLTAFTGPSGLCGGMSETRTVLAIHRGRGTKWEIVFREKDLDVVTTTTADLDSITLAMIGWLQGGALSATENSLNAVASWSHDEGKVD